MSPSEVTELISDSGAAGSSGNGLPPSPAGQPALARRRGRPKGPGTGHHKKGAGPSKVANTPPKALAAGLAKACRWTTIPIIDWLELDATYVLWTAEAKAIAEPLSHILWPYLRQMQLLQAALSKLDEASDGYALLVALYAYIERVGMAAVMAYFAKMQRLRAEAAARQAERIQTHGTPRPAGPVSRSGPGLGQLLSGLVGANGNGASKPAPAPQPTAATGDAAGPVYRAGAGGIPDTMDWGGGPFGASPVPFSYVAPEAWNLATN